MLLSKTYDAKCSCHNLLSTLQWLKLRKTPDWEGRTRKMSQNRLFSNSGGQLRGSAASVSSVFNDGCHSLQIMKMQTASVLELLARILNAVITSLFYFAGATVMPQFEVSSSLIKYFRFVIKWKFILDLSLVR
jgi:hypothetical protein